MTKTELVDIICQKADLPNKVKTEEALDEIIELVRKALCAGQDVTFTGFGSFKVVKRAARKGRNPRTGEEIEIPAGNAIRFTPGKTLKDAVNN